MGIKNKTKKKPSKERVNDDIKRYASSLLTIALSIIGALRIGFLGKATTGLITYLFGNMFGIIYLAAIIVAVYNMLHKNQKKDLEDKVFVHRQYILGFFLLLFIWMIAASIPSDGSLSGFGILVAY